MTEDKGDILKVKKDKLKARAANKKGYRDLVMSTEGISLNIVENAMSDELTKGDLKKAWERLERRWNPKTREETLGKTRSETKEMSSPRNQQKMHQDTFKGSLLGCSENVSNTALTIVCTINVSIDCNGFQVPCPNERKNILD